MLENGKYDKEIYNQLMDEIKSLNNEYLELRYGKRYQYGMAIEYIKKLDLKAIKWYITHLGRKRRQKRSYRDSSISLECVSNYFSDERIAIYTVVFGKYDKLVEPKCLPDNCDYYVITDNFVPESSLWKKIDISEYEEKIKNYSNAEKNRYFKMHPHEVFEKYKYSIYIDGNIEVISDLTEYIARLSDVGIAIHNHRERDCVYDECNAIKLFRKEKKDNVNKYIKLLIEREMPKHYGLLECNVIVREHHNPVCIQVMEGWWNEYLVHIKRDQVSLPYVLYKSGISVEKVGVLGNNVNRNPSFRVLKHQ